MDLKWLFVRLAQYDWNTRLVQDDEHIQIQPIAKVLIIFWSLYKYVILYLSEDSCIHQMFIYPNNVD